MSVKQLDILIGVMFCGSAFGELVYSNDYFLSLIHKFDLNIFASNVRLLVCLRLLA